VRRAVPLLLLQGWPEALTWRASASQGLRENGLAADWRKVKAGDAVFAITPLPRASSPQGYAYLQMRLGHIEEGREAILKLLELDPSDKVGAKVLLGVLDRMGQSDDD
jgi:hypothetical protein